MLVCCCTGSQGPVWTVGGLLPCSRVSWNLACYQNTSHQSVFCTGASWPSPQQTDLPRKALILCKSWKFERWILAYTGVEFKGVPSITSSISALKSGLGMCLYHWCAPVLLVPWEYDPVCLASSEGSGGVTPDSCSPELTLDPVAYSGGPSASAQRHRLLPCSNRILTFVILSGVFTPISPKPIEERENSAATALE